MATDPMRKRIPRESANSEDFQRYSLLRLQLEAGDRMSSVAHFPAKWRALQVLIVDDGKVTNDGLVRLVRSWGHEARIEHECHDVLRTAAVKHPDVVLLDIDMPHANWKFVAGLMRIAYPPEKCFLIGLTERTDDPHSQLCRDFGIELLLGKPVENATLEMLMMLECSRVNKLQTGCRTNVASEDSGPDPDNRAESETGRRSGKSSRTGSSANNGAVINRASRTDSRGSSV